MQFPSYVAGSDIYEYSNGGFAATRFIVRFQFLSADFSSVGSHFTA